jgi:hypothetical protein
MVRSKMRRAHSLVRCMLFLSDFMLCGESRDVASFLTATEWESSSTVGLVAAQPMHSLLAGERFESHSCGFPGTLLLVAFVLGIRLCQLPVI